MDVEHVHEHAHLHRVPAEVVVARLPDLDDAAKYILGRVRPHDVVLTLGAGDGNKVAQQVLAGIQLWSDA